MDTEYINTYWSGEPAVLRGALDLLKADQRVAQIGPVADMTVQGRPVAFVLLALKEPLVPPEGVTEEDPYTGRLAVGVFAAGPRKPTPREFMDRLTREKQLAIYTAGTTNPQVGFFLYRLGSAQVVDVTNPETVAGAEFLKASGLITEEDIAVLLAQ